MHVEIIWFLYTFYTIFHILSHYTRLWKLPLEVFFSLSCSVSGMFTVQLLCEFRQIIRIKLILTTELYLIPNEFLFLMYVTLIRDVNNKYRQLAVSSFVFSICCSYANSILSNCDVNWFKFILFFYFYIVCTYMHC